MITTLEFPHFFFFYPCTDMGVNDQLFVYSQLTALSTLLLHLYCCSLYVMNYAV